MVRIVCLKKSNGPQNLSDFFDKDKKYNIMRFIFTKAQSRTVKCFKLCHS